jgi:hypothetical protein
MTRMSGLACRRSPAARRFGCALALAALVAGTSPAQAPDPYTIDRDKLYLSHVDDDRPVRSEDENPDEFLAYNDILLHAHRLPAADLEKHASRDVTFADLVAKTRTDYQFKLLYFEGRLKRLRRLEPTKPLKEAGVKNLYEGWMFPRDGDQPMCVLTTELPPGLEPSLEYKPAKPVTVAGYSFKLIRYESAEKSAHDPTQQRVRQAPLLMAHSFTLVPQPDADGGKPWRSAFLPGMLAMMAVIGAVVVGLTLWFRRGDRTVRRELDERRDRNPFGEPDHV